MQTVLFIHENHVDDRVVEKMLTDKKEKSYPERMEMGLLRKGCIPK